MLKFKQRSCIVTPKAFGVCFGIFFGKADPPKRFPETLSISRIAAGRHNCLRPVHVVIASLKFGFQLHPKTGQIDQIPPSETPPAVHWRFMLKTRDQMHGIVMHFARRNCWLEVKRAKAAVPAAGSVELRIEIKDAFLVATSTMRRSG
jgi:hypothetical protein